MQRNYSCHIDSLHQVLDGVPHWVKIGPSAAFRQLLVCTLDLMGALGSQIACHPTHPGRIPVARRGRVSQRMPRYWAVAASRSLDCAQLQRRGGSPMKSRMQPDSPSPAAAAVRSGLHMYTRFGGGCRIDWRSRLEEPAATSGRHRPVDFSVLSHSRRAHHSKQAVVCVCARPTVWHFAAHPASAAVSGSVTSRRIAAVCGHRRL